MDNKYCIKENIYHPKVRPETLIHNGKNERSHKNNNEKFYLLEVQRFKAE